MVLQHMAISPGPKIEVYCDFDGTISVGDVFDLFLEKFAPPEWKDIEQEWEDNKIGSRECLARQMDCVLKTTNPHWDEIQRFLDTIKIDTYFYRFIEFTKTNKIPVKIMSDGIDLFIRAIFNHYNIPEMSVYANRIYKNLEMGFPYYLDACEKKSGVCKCSFVTHATNAKTKIYIGDGRSDFCVANKVDIVFAKSKLLEYCKTQNIPHIAFQNFDDVITKLGEYLGQ